jgi:hypothetical protein
VGVVVASGIDKAGVGTDDDVEVAGLRAGGGMTRLELKLRNSGVWKIKNYGRAFCRSEKT